METNLKTLVIIPTYNERESLPEIVPQVLGQGKSIALLIVDDNSPDGTGETAEELAREFSGRMSVLHRAEKNGLGSAYLDGFRWGLGQSKNLDYFIQMDADGSHNPAEIPSLLAAAQSADLIVGSRYLNGVRILDWPIRRLLLSHVSNTITQLATGLPLTDCTSGFKCFRRKTVEKILSVEIHAKSYDFQVEVNTFCKWLGFRLAEIPITFHNRNQGNSKLTRKDILRAATVVFKLAFLRMLPLRFRFAENAKSSKPTNNETG